MISLIVTLFRFLRGVIYGLKDPEFAGLFAFVIILLFTGTIFYSRVEGWSIIDALYFSVITLATVGYGDFAPQTDVGKIFTVVYILVGVGTLLGFLNLVAHHTKENDPIHRLLYKRIGRKQDAEPERSE